MLKLIPCLLLVCLFPIPADAQQSSASAAKTLAERWIVQLDFLGTPVNSSLNLLRDGNKVTGDFDGDKLEGTVTADRLHFLAKDEDGGQEEGTATLKGDAISGTIIFRYSSNPSQPLTMPFTAALALPYPVTPPRHA